MARVHGQERDLGEIAAHGVGVERGHARRAQLLEVERLEIDKLVERAAEVDQGLAGADPSALGVHGVDVEAHTARLGRRLQPLDHQTRGKDHRAAHEQRVGDARVAEARHRCPGLGEVAVGAPRDFLVEVHGQPAAGLQPQDASAIAGAPATRRFFRVSEIKNASSRLCEALRRGSQWVW